MRHTLARALELAAREAVAFAPVAFLWWFAYLDEDDRGEWLSRGRDLVRRATFADLREWLHGPELAYAQWRAADMIRGENEAPTWKAPEDDAAFIASLDATVDELEREGVA